MADAVNSLSPCSNESWVKVWVTWQTTLLCGWIVQVAVSGVQITLVVHAGMVRATFVSLTEPVLASVTVNVTTVSAQRKSITSMHNCER
jgi:hypothetical protein